MSNDTTDTEYTPAETAVVDGLLEAAAFAVIEANPIAADVPPVRVAQLIEETVAAIRALKSTADV